MRITCPICGDRDRREYYYMGADVFLDRPEEGDQDAMHRYLHLRENPAGVTKDLWHHEAGCGAWLVIERNVSTHEIFGVELASKVAS
ncbi:sarcosine oxidase subunit delta [uncultured Litoreibacter sp.]|uniref:sarcosine oxidase subunit delta n=1 Tax=uncultured Litoreibacter sp. TaxID=1392394 RepID=UPI0026272089|nr:sarcosine oxidase subunit delta [uncultured Litoreibacter sp.]